MDKKKTGTVSKNAPNVLSVAKNENGNSGIKRLSTGHLARITPVSPLLIQEVQQGVERPTVPVMMNEEKGREEPNPNHPDYVEAMRKYQEEVGQAVIMAMVMMGVTLVDEDGNPLEIEKGSWINNLKFLEKRTSLDLSEYDFEDESDIEFLYKMFVAIGASDINTIAQSSNITEEAIAESVDNFRGN